MLSNLNGTLSASVPPCKPATSLSPPATLSPSEEFLNLSSPSKPSNRRVTIAVPSPTAKASTTNQPRSTETPDSSPLVNEHDDFEIDEIIDPSTVALPETPTRPYTLTGGENSPVTPYFLHPTKLAQQTCPPKQTHQPLFPLSGKIQDQPDEFMRNRLLQARRKTLQFAPKVKSPLSKGFPFDS